MADVTADETPIVDIVLTRYTDYSEMYYFPYSLSGFSFLAQIRDDSGTLKDTFTCTVSTSSTTIDGVVYPGNVTVSLAEANINLLTDTSVYLWDLVQTDSSSKKSRVCKGSVTIDSAGSHV